MRSRSGAVPSGPRHHSHKTLGLRRLSPRGRRSTSTKMSVPTTMGRGPLLPRPSWFRTLGCNSEPTLVRARIRNRPPRSDARLRVLARSRDHCTSSSARGEEGVLCVRADRRGSGRRRSAAPLANGRESGKDIPQAPAAPSRDRSPPRRRTGKQTLAFRVGLARSSPALWRPRWRPPRVGVAARPRERSNSRG
jgi:hypothetical protein